MSFMFWNIWFISGKAILILFISTKILSKWNDNLCNFDREYLSVLFLNSIVLCYVGWLKLGTFLSVAYYYKRIIFYLKISCG